MFQDGGLLTALVWKVALRGTAVHDGTYDPSGRTSCQPQEAQEGCEHGRVCGDRSGGL